MSLPRVDWKILRYANVSAGPCSSAEEKGNRVEV